MGASLPVDWNGDDLHTTDPSRFARWQGSAQPTLGDFQDASAQELQGISAPPQLANPAGGIFRPLEGSAVIDAGLALPGINDGFLGAAPDIGAFETSPDDLIFRDDFEAGTLAAWSTANTGDGDLSAAAPAAQAGTAAGLQAVVDDLTGLYVQDDTPEDEPRYRARFYFDPNGFDPGEAEGHRRWRVFVLFTGGPTRRVGAVVLRRVNGAYGVMGRARLDSNVQVDTAFIPLADAPHVIEVELRRASGPDTQDGAFQIWIDGLSREVLPGLDNNRAEVDFVRLGALNVKGGSAGTTYLDQFESRRTSYIGPLP
jgi:hypothetical protein